jgi:hypothetical protein
MQSGNKSSVYVVQNDARKDLSDAERFGQLKDLFGNVPRVYNTPRMIEHARRVLSHWQRGDSLLMMGDPALCGVAIAIASEFDCVVNVLSWDKHDYKYVMRTWDFDLSARNVLPDGMPS